MFTFLTKHHAMKAYWGSGGIAPHIDLGTRWRWVVSYTPWPLYPQGKSPWYPFDRRLGGPQSRSGRSGEEKNYQPPPESNPRTPIVQPVAQRYTDWTIILMFTILTISCDQYKSWSSSLCSILNCYLKLWHRWHQYDHATLRTGRDTRATEIHSVF
jgi:hypothetical protein